MDGTEQKLLIITYKDGTFSSEVDKLEASIQPNNISINGSLSYMTGAAIGAPNAFLRYATAAPRIMSFSLIFDATGAINGIKDNVSEKCEKLKELLFDYNKEQKSPYFVRILWGEIDFKGRLLNLEVSYKMFSPSGKPIRALAKISISETTADKKKTNSTQETNNPTSRPGSSASGDNSPVNNPNNYNSSLGAAGVASIGGASLGMAAFGGANNSGAQSMGSQSSGVSSSGGASSYVSNKSSSRGGSGNQQSSQNAYANQSRGSASAGNQYGAANSSSSYSGGGKASAVHPDDMNQKDNPATQRPANDTKTSSSVNNRSSNSLGSSPTNNSGNGPTNSSRSSNSIGNSSNQNVSRSPSSSPSPISSSSSSPASESKLSSQSSPSSLGQNSALPSSGMHSDLGGVSAAAAIAGGVVASVTVSPIMSLFKEIEHLAKEGYEKSKNFVESKV